MRIWARTINNQKLHSEVVREFALARPSDFEAWMKILHSLCQELDLSRPVLLNKHLRELEQFNHTVFKPTDFMEPVSFDRFEIEILIEKKHETVF